ncbi:MAG: hypothetical protein QNJ31_04210 [Candidatus Caenarcaniphilales bacterium]|nr:hypothetical protein [Candidatus Caenarcaniphilales bacterium]
MNKLGFDSEILEFDNQIYLPVRQLAELTDVEIEYDRRNRTIKFKEVLSANEVEISAIEKQIKVAGSILEPSTNPVYWIQNSFFLKEEILISKDLIENLLDLKINYDANELIFSVFTNRNLKILRPKLRFSDDLDEEIVNPLEPPKFNLKTIQSSYSARGQAVQSTSPSQSNNRSFLINNLDVDLVAEVGNGTYRAGPNFFFIEDKFGLSGIRQSWRKNLKKNLGLILGDNNVQMSRLNFSGADILGAQIGTPLTIGSSLSDTLLFEGSCETNSEILLLLNEQRIARVVCRADSYSFPNIPRLINPNNIYKVVQRNTDGTEVVLREERLSFYADLIPEGEKRWQTFLGRPSLTVFRQPSVDGRVTEPQIPNKVIGGSQIRYGLTPRITIEGDVSGDYLLSRPDFFNPNDFNNDFLILDPRLMSGQTASVGISTRPRDSFGIHWNAAISNASSPYFGEFLREGAGYASFVDFDWRGKNFSNRGSLYYFSPEFYSSGGTVGNRMGGNLSFAGTIKKHSLTANFQRDVNNLDGKSFEGRQNLDRFTVNHNYRVSSRASMQNTLNYSKTKSNLFDSRVTTGRSFLRYALNSRMDATFSSGFVNQELKTPSLSRNFLGDVTIGGTYFLNRKKTNQLNFGGSIFSDDTKNYFLQGRFGYKQFVYQPAISLFQGRNNANGFSLTNGLFWQSKDGLRIGVEHTFSNIENTFGTELGDRGKTETTSHDVSVTLFNTIGFFDGKPHILPSPLIGGYLRGKVFLDLNNDGTQQSEEPGIPNAKIVLRDKPLETDAQGNFSLINIPEGKYEAYIDTLSLPFTLTPANQFFRFKVESGKITELNFTVSLNAGSVSGTLTLRDLKGNVVESNNIVVVAIDSEGNEAAYTYTSRNGSYILSELPPGEFTIKIDEAEIVSRNIDVKSSLKKVTIPLNMDDVIEIEDINLDALQTSF